MRVALRLRQPLPPPAPAPPDPPDFRLFLEPDGQLRGDVLQVRQRPERLGVELDDRVPPAPDKKSDAVRAKK